MILLLGALWYNLDRAYCLRLYRWWHGMTHEHPLPPEVNRGFVYGQPTKVRAFAALLLSTLIAVVALPSSTRDYALTELLLWAGGVPGIILGFLLGPYVYTLWRRRETVFDTVDRIERGDVDISDELKERSEKLGGGIRAWLAKAAGWFKRSPAGKDEPGEADAKQIEEAPPVPDTIPEEKAQEMVEQFIRKRTGGNDG